MRSHLKRMLFTFDVLCEMVYRNGKCDIFSCDCDRGIKILELLTPGKESSGDREFN